MSAEFVLGQRVRFAEHIVRVSRQEWEKGKPDRFWSGEAYPGKRRDGGEGIIIGKRTLTEGNVASAQEGDGWGTYTVTTYEKTRHFTAWLVVKDLRSKPVYVLPEHIEALEASK
jgi:hypothetical protein